jgi:hypothetical protein
MKTDARLHADNDGEQALNLVLERQMVSNGFNRNYLQLMKKAQSIPCHTEMSCD